MAGEAMYHATTPENSPARLARQSPRMTATDQRLDIHAVDPQAHQAVSGMNRIERDDERLA
jgi:hypothetical protein